MKKYIPFLLIAIVVVLLFVGVGVSVLMNNNADANLQSGVEGTAFIGPTCPVQILGMEGQCNNNPYKATVTIKDENDQQVKTFQTDDQGKFKVNLKPGTYTFVSQNSKIPPRLPSTMVSVEENKYTQIQLIFDSGLR